MGSVWLSQTGAWLLKAALKDGVLPTPHPQALSLSVTSPCLIASQIQWLPYETILFLPLLFVRLACYGVTAGKQRLRPPYSALVPRTQDGGQDRQLLGRSS